MPIGLLVQRCKIYRPTDTPTKVFGRPTGEGVQLVLVKASAACRLDFTFLRGSREERASEEYVARNRGLLNLLPSEDIQPRDIITMNDPAYQNTQYEVEFVDPQVDGSGVSHFEVTVVRRDNPYTLP